MAGNDSMDVEYGVENSEPSELPQYSVQVLQLIKLAQSQHGARYSDYQRYRRYCTARLRRLYKSLKFLHGRGKYVKRSLESSMITDARYLHIPLYCAERAWGYAMELKAIDSGPDLPRKRLHLIARMTKAARWADLLAKLCSERSDPKTSLEAEAYASYMWGNVLLERESDWEAALNKFLRVRAVYEHLGKVGEVSHQVLCRQRVEEMEPNIRYCNYKMGRSDNSEVVKLGSSTEENPVLGLLHAKLEAVMQEVRSEQAASLTELTYLGRSLPIYSTKTKLSILKAQEIEKDLRNGSPERKLGLFDKLFFTYQEAKRQIREDLVTAGGAEDVKEELNSLDIAISSLLLQRTIERNLLLVSLAKARLDRQHMRGAGSAKDEKATKPEDLIRLFDTLIQNVSDLLDLTTSGRQQRQEDLKFATELEAKKQFFRACRCFYVAQSYANTQKLPEAYALFVRTAEIADAAVASFVKLEQRDLVEEQEAKQLAALSRNRKCMIHAQANLDKAKSQTGLQDKIAKVSIADKAASEGEERFLVDFLDEYMSALGPANKLSSSKLAQIPPPYKTVPCRPIVLDTAFNAIEFPSLDGRTKTKVKPATTTGWLGGIFGRR